MLPPVFGRALIAIVFVFDSAAAVGAFDVDAELKELTRRADSVLEVLV
jgi:hypothetical protein